MFKYQFHEKWVLPLLALLLCTLHIAAQCPQTKSATFAMVPQGIPSLDRLQPTDFFIDVAEAENYFDLDLSKDHFLCVDVGIQTVEMTGFTLGGEAINCSEFVWIYDSVFLCGKDIVTPMAVAGKIVTEKQQAVANVAIGLSSGSVNYFKGTNEQGVFIFENFEQENYQLTPTNTFDENIRNGITTLDLLLLQKHVLGIRPLQSPYKIIAADLNNSGDITAFDMLLLRRLILSMIEVFPNTPSWKFIDANYEFENEQAPLTEAYPQSINLNMKDLGPQLDTRFIAVKMGDLNNSADVSPRARSRSDGQKKSVSLFEIRDQTFTEGETIQVPLTPTQDLNLNGLQFSISFPEDHLELMQVEGDLAISDANYSIKNGAFHFSWHTVESINLNNYREPLVLTFRAKTNGQTANLIQLSNKHLQAEVYTPQDEIIPFNLNWKHSSGQMNFQVFNNYPNPFSTQTIIPFNLPVADEVQLSIFNAKGQLIHIQKNTFPKGSNQFEVENIFDQSGIYIYRLESDFGVANGRMNVVFQ